MNWTRRAALVCLLAAHVHVAADPSPDIAALYVEAAYEAFQSGELDRTMQLALIALEFDEESSDAGYLAASAAALRRETTREAIARARLSLELGNWRRFDAESAAVLLGGLYNRVGAFESAAGLLAGTVPGVAAGEAPRARWHYEYARALTALGRLTEADALISVARDLFPDDPRFFWFLLRAEPYPSTEYRREIERLRMRSPAGERRPQHGPGLEDLLYLYARQAPTAGEREWAREELERLGFRDPRVALLHLPDDPQGAVDLFLSRDGFADHATYREILLGTTGASHARILDAAADFSGSSYVDPNGDGWWTERLSVEQGMIVRWERDQNRDGIVELSLEFDARAPRSLEAVRDDEHLRLVYGQYPYLESGEIADEHDTVRFVVRPRAVAVAAVSGLAADGPRFDSDVSLMPVVGSIDQDELRRASVRVDTVRPDGSVAQRIYLRDGSTHRVLRDELGDGSWDRLLLYDGEVPTAGVRDLTGDGYFEVVEGYREGRLVALAIDTTGDGAADVFERHEEVPAREWDLNGDGRIDAREFRIWSESVIREFPAEERLW